MHAMRRMSASLSPTSNERVGVGLQPGGGVLVLGLAEVAAERDPIDADRLDARGELAR